MNSVRCAFPIHIRIVGKIKIENNIKNIDQINSTVKIVSNIL